IGAPPTRHFDFRERAGYPLALYCWEGPELLLKIAADATCEPDAVARMAGHLAVMLEAMSQHGSRPVGQLPMLTLGEKEQFARWNETRRDFPATQCIHDLVRISAGKNPGKTAVVFGNDSLSYSELESRAGRLAHHLRARGVAAGDLVGLCIERSCDMVVAMLGILKAGAAYVPLDPAYPRERIAHMVADSGAALIVTQRSLAAGLPSGGAILLCLDEEWPRIGQEPGDKSLPAASPEGVAYVIYTSGSTGKPKGIAIEHRSVVNFLESMRHEPGLGADDTLLAVTTISFDIAALEIFLPLVTGATILLASRETAADPAQLTKLFARATVMQATPATWRMLVQSGWSGSASLKILCGGEALAPELARELLSRCGALWNMYGPTETTIWSTCHKIEGVATPVPVGRPIANTTVHILGKDLQSLPVDVPGELYIGGAGLARGYHNLPELTREKFTQVAGERLYATGDLSRFAPDGTIEVLGRIDRQVKIRGFRIEAGEIETRLNEFPGMQQSAVVDLADSSGEKILVAYYVNDSKEISPGELRAFLSERLPAYMVPSAFMALERLPLTPNGKVDYRALPATVVSQAASRPDSLPPRGATQEKLAAIWSEVLRGDAVDARDNFFDLGGHSLTATVLAMRIGSAFGVDFPLGEIFQHPVFAEIADAIERLAPRAGGGTRLLRADSAHAHDPFPLTDLQQAYFTGRSEGFSLGNIALHAYAEFEPESLDVARANAALRALIARHPMLRAVIREDGSQQVLEKTPDYNIHVVDLDGRPADEIARILAAERERMSHEIFNLHSWPWFEIRAVQLDETRHRLLVSYDATMLDAWSA
ncbi:MAG TPA: amino acid adenylation domain-containing protein, partial [Chthoniobacteraceae bacterium]|nr:amino acid adenylation domain-containing protein [Chthoniobacteraceae bacterium]